jgi:hypothetical protein
LQRFIKEIGKKPGPNRAEFADGYDGNVEYIKASLLIEDSWITKFQSSYNKRRYGQRLQDIVNELGIQGVKRGFLDACARGGIRDGAEAQLLVETLVSVANQLGGIYVFPRKVYSEEQFNMMPESEIHHKVDSEPGFLFSYEQYLQAHALKRKYEAY